MSDVQIFHSPSCSKSRGALEILEERGVDANVVRYLDTPPDRATLVRILDAIDEDPQALVRVDDDKFKRAGLSKSDVTTREQVIEKASRQIFENQTDACVANGPAYGEGFGLVTPDGCEAVADADTLYRALEHFIVA